MILFNEIEPAEAEGANRFRKRGGRIGQGFARRLCGASAWILPVSCEARRKFICPHLVPYGAMAWILPASCTLLCGSKEKWGIEGMLSGETVILRLRLGWKMVWKSGEPVGMRIRMADRARGTSPGPVASVRKDNTSAASRRPGMSGLIRSDGVNRVNGG